MKGKSLSRVRLLVTPWTAAFQAPPSMGFSRQEYWSGVPLPSLDTQLIIKYQSLASKLIKPFKAHSSALALLVDASLAL